MRAWACACVLCKMLAKSRKNHPFETREYDAAAIINKRDVIFVETIWFCIVRKAKMGTLSNSCRIISIVHFVMGIAWAKKRDMRFVSSSGKTTTSGWEVRVVQESMPAGPTLCD